MFNQMGGGYSLSDIAAATGGNGRNDGGWAGDGAWWIIILFLFCFAGWGNNGWGNGNGGGGTTSVREQIDFSGLRNSMTDLLQGTANGFYNVNTGMLNGFGNVTEAVNGGVRSLQSDICDTNMANLQNKFDIATQLSAIQAQNAECCCTTQQLINSNFADLNYNLATQACQNRQATVDSAREIIAASQDNTRAILDFLVQDKIGTLTAENTTLRNAASQAEQNAYLISQLRPQANPAYIVANPYSSTGCCGNGTGCSY